MIAELGHNRRSKSSMAVSEFRWPSMRYRTVMVARRKNTRVKMRTSILISLSEVVDKTGRTRRLSGLREGGDDGNVSKMVNGRVPCNYSSSLNDGVEVLNNG